MDVQAFSECLVYMDGVNGNSDVYTTLIGVAAGFAFSLITEEVRGLRNRRKLKAQFEENMERAMESAQKTFLGAASIADCVSRGERGFIYSFGHDMEPQLLTDSYAVFSNDLKKEQREAFARARAKARLVDSGVEDFRALGKSTEAVNYDVQFAAALRLMNNSASCYLSCKDFLDGTISNSFDVFALARSMGVEYHFFLRQ